MTKNIVWCLLILMISGTAMAAQEKSLLFIENIGQITDQYGQPRKDIHYVLEGKGLMVYIGKGMIHYQFSDGKKMCRLEARLERCNGYVPVVASDPEAYSETYFLPSVNGKMAHSFKTIVYKNIYPDIDWILRINDDNKLEHEFAVGKKGRVDQISMKYSGASNLHINNDGAFVAQTSLGCITEHAPKTFRHDGSLLSSRYRLQGERLSYQTEPFKGALLIDPKVEWATYYGDTSYTASDVTNTQGLAIDRNGNVYMSGTTNAGMYIASTGAYQATLLSTVSPGANAYYVKFDTSGRRLYATYFGGTGRELLGKISIDKHGNVYLYGSTTSKDIATPFAQQSSFTGESALFLAKFAATGNLLWSTYCGGENKIQSAGVLVLDTLDHIYLAGGTISNSTIATPGTHRPVKADTSLDGFVLKYNSSGKRIWGTYVGGNGNDVVLAIEINRANNHLYLLGHTISDTGIATPGTAQPLKSAYFDAFLMKLDTSGKRLWGTYVGGESSDIGHAICVDSADGIYVCGTTSSKTGLSTGGSWQEKIAGSNDGFLVKFGAAGNRLWGTYFGGEGLESALALATDNRNVYVAGYTASKTSIADTAAFKPTISGSGDADGFIAAFRADGHKIWSSYYGGMESDVITAAAYGHHHLYIAGNTNSADGIATPGAHMPVTANNYQKSFLVRISNPSEGWKTTGIKEFQLPVSQLRLYPNPATDVLYVHARIGIESGIAAIRVVDITGKTVQYTEAQMTSGILEHHFVLSGTIVPGIYELEVHCKGMSGSARLIRQ